MIDVLSRVKRTNKFFLGLIVFYIGGALALGLSGLLSRVSQEMSMILGQLLAIIPACGYCVITKEVPFGSYYRERLPIVTMILLVFLALAVLPVVWFINMLSMLVVPNFVAGALADMQTMPLVLNVALIALMPAVVEETIFRGIVYRNYAMKNPLRGMVLSGFLFALLHLNLNQIAYALPLGMLLAFVMELTGSFLAPMIVHFTINGTNAIISWFAMQAVDLSEMADLSEGVMMETALPVASYVILFVIALMAAGAVFGLLWAVAYSSHHAGWMKDLLHGRAPVLLAVDGVPVKKGLGDVWLWAGVAIAIVYTVL